MVIMFTNGVQIKVDHYPNPNPYANAKSYYVLSINLLLN